MKIQDPHWHWSRMSRQLTERLQEAQDTRDCRLETQNLERNALACRLRQECKLLGLCVDSQPTNEG